MPFLADNAPQLFEDLTEEVLLAFSPEVLSVLPQDYVDTLDDGIKQTLANIAIHHEIFLALEEMGEGEVVEAEEPPAEEDENNPQLDMWRQFLNEVREQRMSTYSFLSAGRFCGMDNGQAIVCFDPENSYNKKHLEEKNVKKLLEETLRAVIGEPIKIKLIIESEKSGTSPIPKPGTPEKSEAAKSEESKKRLVEEAMTDPIIRKVIELFKGKIVHVSG